MTDSKFGTEIGFVHKLFLTGRKVGADLAFWTKLADDKSLLARVVGIVMGPADEDDKDQSRPENKHVTLGLGHTRKLIDALEKSDISDYDLRQLMASGLIEDLLEVQHPHRVDRELFRKLIRSRNVTSHDDEPSFDDAQKFISIVESKTTSFATLNTFLSIGLLQDMLTSSFSLVKRSLFREFLDLPQLED